MTVNMEQVEGIGKLLLGAAHADGEVDGSELDVIVDILCEFVGADHLPAPLVARLHAFDYGTFDVARTCADLKLDNAEDRRAMLTLVAEVIEADEILDSNEDAYLRVVARHIFADPAEYADLLA